MAGLAAWWWIEPVTTGFVDDDELGDVQALLWHGYAPPAFPRIPPDQREFIHNTLVDRRRYDQRRYRAPRQPRQPQPTQGIWGKWHHFQCGRCKGSFMTLSSEEEIDAEFIAQFGEARREDRVAVCEPCYEILMAEREKELH